MAVINTLLYFIVTLGLLAAFMYVYEKTTPYREFQEIKSGNTAAAIAFGGAILGFVIPLGSVVLFTHSIGELIKWGIMVGIIQIVTFQVIHRLHGFGDCVREGKVAGATFLAFCSAAVGIINATCISY